MKRVRPESAAGIASCPVFLLARETRFNGNAAGLGHLILSILHVEIFFGVTALNTGKDTLSCSINYPDIHPPGSPGKKFCSPANGVKLCICMYASTFKMQRKQNLKISAEKCSGGLPAG